MQSKTLRLAIGAILAGSTAATAQFAVAQQAGGLEEIVVTATRRGQDLQEVPVSIVAITGDDLELKGLDSLEDVGQFVPNINIIGGGAGTFGPTFRVRGLPRIGLYVDGVWQINDSGFLTSDFVDIDRVEVLRGPQGTRYGRDAVGGAIRIFTTRPGDEFGGSITATTGSLDRRDVKAVVDVPITDRLKTKWTASSLYRDGYIQSLSIDQKYGLSDQEVFRGDMLWEPTDNLSFRLTYTNDDQKLTEPRIQDAIFNTGTIPGPDGVVGTADDVQNWGVLMRDFYGLAIEANPTRYAGFLPYTAENYTSGYPGGRIGKWETSSSTMTPSHIVREQTTLDVNWNITDNITVDFLTASQKIATDIIIDWDGSNYDIVGDLSRTRADVFSEEIQLNGGGDRVSWIAGAYYWDQSSVTRADRRTLGDFFTYPGGPNEPFWRFEDAYASQLCMDLADPVLNPAGPTHKADCQFAAGFAAGPFAFDNLTYNQTDGYAIFGEATISLTDRLDFTLGVRHHDQTVETGPMAFIPGVTAPQTARTDILHTGGDPFAGIRQIDPDAPPVSFDKNTFEASLQMQFNDDIMGYISYTEGFNSGGIDSVTLNDPNTNTSRRIWFPYDPEVIENKEIGMRADLVNGRLRVNATYFDSDWKNIQNSGVVHDPDSGVELPTLATTNVGTANASGVELELTVVPTDQLTLNFNVGLLDTGYTYLAPGTPQLTLDTEFQQAPDQTYSVGLQYVADLSNGGSLTTRIDYAHSSQFWRSLPFLRLDWYGSRNNGPVPDGYDEAGQYGIVNARVSFQPASADYVLSVFGTNLTNEYVLNSGFFHGIWGYDFSTVGRPREFGASFQFNF